MVIRVSEAQPVPMRTTLSSPEEVIAIASYPDGFLLDWTGNGRDAKLITSKALDLVEALNDILGDSIGSLDEIEIRGSRGRIVIIADYPLIRISLEKTKEQLS